MDSWALFKFNIETGQWEFQGIQEFEELVVEWEEGEDGTPDPTKKSFHLPNMLDSFRNTPPELEPIFKEL
jgi:hypothetical protein